MLDLVRKFFKMQPSRRSVKTHYGFDSNGSSLSTEFQVCFSKCWDPYVSPDCMIRLVFFWGFSSLFQDVDLVTTSLRGWVPGLPLLALGSVCVGQGSTIQFAES